MPTWSTLPGASGPTYPRTGGSRSPWRCWSRPPASWRWTPPFSPRSGRSGPHRPGRRRVRQKAVGSRFPEGARGRTDGWCGRSPGGTAERMSVYFLVTSQASLLLLSVHSAFTRMAAGSRGALTKGCDSMRRTLTQLGIGAAVAACIVGASAEPALAAPVAGPDLPSQVIAELPRLTVSTDSVSRIVEPRPSRWRGNSGGGFEKRPIQRGRFSGLIVVNGPLLDLTCAVPWAGTYGVSWDTVNVSCPIGPVPKR
ncbi:hypothetical protein SAMN05216268_11112 [Streptomyces yunnanensis]|uniref:Uncharacterized protein n=1 Tax=Streptomyces yunnanensis TaxID=156453 RepID=A0A9X8QVH0_9ACTN|nr:hypothetical protein SAMN05216268_11112 [Streptomyces yunnanensis]